MGITMTAKIDLVLGGARSGKSRMAEQRAQDSQLQCVYLATASALDDEMAQRIAHHRASRDDSWHTVEEGLALAQCLQRESAPDRCIVVDCLTLWLSNCLHANCWKSEREQLLETLPGLRGHIVFVSNETGMGVVPMGELTREFVDEAGFLHQALATACDEVTLCVAGLPLTIKP